MPIRGKAAGVAAHDILDGTAHPDSVADAVTRGSLIYGNSTPKWDELVKGTAGHVLTAGADDISWAASAAASHGSTHCSGGADPLSSSCITSAMLDFSTWKKIADYTRTGDGDTTISGLDLDSDLAYTFLYLWQNAYGARADSRIELNGSSSNFDRQRLESDGATTTSTIAASNIIASIGGGAYVQTYLTLMLNTVHNRPFAKFWVGSSINTYMEFYTGYLYQDLTDNITSLTFAGTDQTTNSRCIVWKMLS